MLKIKRALISVSDKTGVVELAKTLDFFGVEIISTGGTASMLKKEGVRVVEMSDYTGFPEMLHGRVKTLHPKIHAGLLSLRDNPDHMEQIQAHGIGLIDMVVVNLYPFEETIKKENVTLKEAIENIDIGGPSMLHSAAKNYESIAVVSDPKFYPQMIEALGKNNGSIPKVLLKELACEAFRLTAAYDCLISCFLAANLCSREDRGIFFPDSLMFGFKKVVSLRYGENPHQKASLYRWADETGSSLVNARQLHGKELSFNNYLDLNSVLEIVRAFKAPMACIVKHNNPTGVACASTLVKAYEDARHTDTLSVFGGIVGLNKKVDFKTAKAILKTGFLECILAPAYGKAALSLLKTKKNLRLIEVSLDKRSIHEHLDFKKINGGILVQEADAEDFKKADLKIVTRRKPTKKEFSSLLFAWNVMKFVKSNAIVLAKGTKTVGIGMGQTSRVDSLFMAVKRAGARTRDAVLASDGFLPKVDNIVLAKKAGIKAIIQPGGSISDEDVIEAADRAKIAMVFTGIRHFKH